MGQGYSLTTLSAGSAGIDVPELADLSYEKTLGDARFMKTIRARHAKGLVATKVVMKPYASMRLDTYIKAINSERHRLEDIPNALAFHRAFETSNHGYLLRQYTYSSLYDRMSTRPFLEDVEKRWLAFQLLTAVKECHAKELYHGDIKTENCLVTSWNWLFLSDFSSSFKPVYLPEDNPADFSFFFDISGRRTCYLAPERFLSAGEVARERSSVTWAMDIFSVGCVIAELFCEGPIFNLSQLFNYRAGNFDPVKEQLSRIEDVEIREMIAHMIQLEPESRYSADEYLNFWRAKAFPEYFYSFLHQYMFLITDPSSGKTAITADKANLGESDDRIARVYHDFDKISYFLGYDESSSRRPNDGRLSEMSNAETIFPLNIDLPHRRQVNGARSQNAGNDGTYIFLNIVTASIRSTARASARLQACDLLLSFAEHVPDEGKLDRILPFVVSLLDDRSDVVRVAALRTLAQLLAIITTTSPVNAYIFPEYIIPRLNEILSPRRGKKPSSVIRTAYAQCIARLAEAAARFLDTIQALRREGSLPSLDPESDESHVLHAYQDYYDIAHADLVRFFEVQTRLLLTDSDPAVKRAFLGSVPSLCVFFGSSKTNDAILSHLNTYLNDKDWKLKCAFFDAIVGVAIYVGSSSLEDFILPLMTLALSDPEEFVIDRALRSLGRMAELGLFQKTKAWDLIDLVARFTMHPSSWIREAAAKFIDSATKFVSNADLQCIAQPLIAPYLRMMPSKFDETRILDVLKKPLHRSIYHLAMTWAASANKSTFWKTLEKRAASADPEECLCVISSRELAPSSLQKFPKNEEDQQWITRLREAGLSHEDEVKLLALSESVWRITKRTSKDGVAQGQNTFDSQIQLGEEQLKQVSFDTARYTWEDAPPPSSETPVEPSDRLQTIADALLDASTTIGEQEIRRPPTQPLPIAQRQSSGAPSTLGSPRNGKIGSDGSSERAISLSDGTPSRANIRTPLPIRHKSSAMHLMKRESSGRGKAVAETSTSSENAFGKVDGAATRENSSQPSPTRAGAESPRRPTPEVRYKAGAGYRGRDPNVLKLLGSIYLENTSLNMTEFGPSVKPIKQTMSEKKGGAAFTPSWRPSGVMIATFSEHSGAISCIAMAPDHSFFISGSEDGSVKVWDSSRLERNLAHRSRQTYKLAAGTGVTTLAFIGNTLCFAIGANDGTIHIVRVDRATSEQTGTKYNKLRLVRQWHVPDAPTSHPVWSECVSTATSHFLLVATNRSKVHAMDLRKGDVLYTLDNPVQHGTPTTFCVGPNPHHWLLLGTSHGVLDLWDLRFRLRLRSFAFPGTSPIHRITLHPSHGDESNETEVGTSKNNVVFVAGGTGTADVTAWDLQELKCIEVYRGAPPAAMHAQPGAEPASAKASTSSPRRDASTSTVNVTNLDLSPYTPWNPDTTPRPTLLNRFSSSQPFRAGESDADQARSRSPTRSQNAVATAPTQQDRSFRALFAGVRAAAEGSGAPYLLTGGPGATVRFWDLKDQRSIGQSCIVAAGDDVDEESPPSYEVAGRKNGTLVCEERFPKPEADGGKDGKSKDGKDKRRKEKPKSRPKGLGRELLLQRHLDAVTDLTVVEVPYRMVISGDRSGIIFVWS